MFIVALGCCGVSRFVFMTLSDLILFCSRHGQGRRREAAGRVRRTFDVPEVTESAALDLLLLQMKLLTKIVARSSKNSRGKSAAKQNSSHRSKQIGKGDDKQWEARRNRCQFALDTAEVSAVLTVTVRVDRPKRGRRHGRLIGYDAKRHVCPRNLHVILSLSRACDNNKAARDHQPTWLSLFLAREKPPSLQNVAGAGQVNNENRFISTYPLAHLRSAWKFRFLN